MSDTCYSNSDLLGLAGRAVARQHGMPVSKLGQKVDFTATSAVNSVDLPLDAHVMLTATQACFVSFGDSSAVAAVDVDMYMAANVPYLVRLGANRRVAAIRATADGVLYVTPMMAE